MVEMKTLHGFTFVELLLSTALGLILLLSLGGLLQHFLVAVRTAQTIHSLYDEAAMITRQWQKPCLNLNIYQVGVDALPEDFPKNSVKKLLPGSIVLEEGIPPQKTYWFAMQNAQKEYGIYRLVLPDETAPEEFISHVKSLYAFAALPGGEIIAAKHALPWDEISWARFQLTLGDQGQTIAWPVSVANCAALHWWPV